MDIVLDKNRTFNEHLKLFKLIWSKSIGILFEWNQFLSQNILKLLHEWLIKPYLTYGIEAWYSAPNYLTKQIFTKQKKSIRTILNFHFNAHTNSSFKNLEILKLPEFFKENITVYFYNTINRGMNLNVSPFMVSHSEIHVHNTRNRNRLVLPLTRKSRTQAGFLFQGIKEWNNLTEDMKSANSSKILRRKLRKYYIENY